MAYEIASNEINKLTGPQLIDHLIGNLRASDAISNGMPGGLIDSLDRSRFGTTGDGIAHYSAGTDRMRNLAVNATFSSGSPMAYKYLGNQDPTKLHLLAELDSRYDGATGKTPMMLLACMAIGMSYIAAEESQSSVRSIIATESTEPVVIEDEGQFEAYLPMKAIDTHIASLRQPGQVNSSNTSVLARGFNTLMEEDLHEESDVCIIISDFLGGATFDKNNSVVVFDWEKSFGELHRALGDRLFAIRLVTPAQGTIPYSQHYLASGQRAELDLSDYLTLAENAQQIAASKAARITRLLRLTRSMELNTTDKFPQIALSDFMFGESPDA